ncbi:MAG: CbtA family protein [Frankiales bacterium]|nr:CbtA family protein [Frankiales bacterium]
MAPVVATLLRGLLAGAVAGLTTGLAGLVFAEPTLDAAIALETGGGGELFSRSTQQLGLVLGLVLVGAALGLLFGLAYRLVPAGTRPWHRSLLLALGGFTALYLVPFLRYPANPPGVGDPSTLESRTSSYLLCVALGVAVVTGAYAAVRALDRRGVGGWQRQIGVTVAALLVVGTAYALLPDAAAPLGDTPAGLVWDFRLRSLGLQALLYALLGTVFGVLAERSAATRPVFAERV